MDKDSSSYLKDDNSSHVKSVARALQILDLMAEKRESLSLKDIADSLNWPKSTVHGIISTMRDYGYISQSERDGKYTLGVRLFELGNILQTSWDIHEIARPMMMKLNAQFGETVHLATEDNGEVLYLEKIDSHHLLRIVSQVGSRLPMYCTGVGKVLLAFQSPQKKANLIKQQSFQSYTGRTITNISALEKELTYIREKGFACDNGEIMDSLQCVAAPIYDKDCNVSYALSVSGLSNNMNQDHIESITRALLSACRNISKEFGYNGPDHT